MPLYRIFCKSYYRPIKGGDFVETRADASPNKEKYEYEGDNPKQYGCGGNMGYELNSPYKLPVLREETDAYGNVIRTIYLLPRCERCNCPQNGSPAIEAEEVKEGDDFVDIDWSFDYFGVFGLETTATSGDIKRKYTELARKFHTDKAQNNEERKIFNIRFQDIGKAYDVLKNKDAHQRLLNGSKYMEFACPGCGLAGRKREDCIKSSSSMRWFHSPACGRAWNKAQGYDVGIHTWTGDGGGGGEPQMPPSSNDKCANGCGRPKPLNPTPAGWDRTHGYLFCSDPCTQNFFRNLRQLYTQGINKLNKLTQEQKAQFINQIDTGIPGNFDNIYTQAKNANQDSGKNNWPKRTCAGCGTEKTFYARYWWRWSEASKDDFSCSEQCLFDYWSRKGTCPNGKLPRICSWCGKPRVKDNSDNWRHEKGGKMEGMFFCSESHLKEQKKKMEEEGGLGPSGGGGGPDFQKLKQKRRELIEDMMGLDGWDELSDTVQNNFIAEVESAQLNQLNDIWTRFQDAIRNYWNNIRQDFINKIKALDKLTEAEKQVFIDLINLGDPANFNNILSQATDANQSKGGRDELKVLKNSTLAQLDGELLKEPAVDNSELEAVNQNWRTAIQNATEEEQIKSIKAAVLADIARKREVKKIVNLRAGAIQQIQTELSHEPEVKAGELDNQNWEKEINDSSDEKAIASILARVLADIKSKRETKLEGEKVNQLLAQAKENWNDYQKLENIFSQIKNLRSSDAYSRKESEIKAVENRLRELNPTQFQETTKNLLSQQIKNNGLTEKDLDAETKALKKQAEDNPTEENIKKAEEGIAVCGATKNLTNILQKVKKVVSERDKKELIDEILMFCKKNKYTKQVSQKYKNEIEAALAQLEGKTGLNNTSPGKSKAVMLTLTIGVLGIGIVAVVFLIWKRKRRLANNKIK